MTKNPIVRLARLEKHHRNLDARVETLAERPWLLPSEQKLIGELKRRRLRAKDRIVASRSAPHLRRLAG